MSCALLDKAGGHNCKSSPSYGEQQRLCLGPGVEEKEREGHGGWAAFRPAAFRVFLWLQTGVGQGSGGRSLNVSRASPQDRMKDLVGWICPTGIDMSALTLTPLSFLLSVGFSHIFRVGPQKSPNENTHSVSHTLAFENIHELNHNIFFQP